MKSFIWISLVVIGLCCVLEARGRWSSSTGTKQVENKVQMVDVTKHENEVKTHRVPKTSRPLTFKERCCHLGRRAAKVGEKCKYSYTVASLRPNYKHYHKLKTKLWLVADRPVINGHLLRKCKRFKVFYEKCCKYESRLIDLDIKRMIKRLEWFQKTSHSFGPGKS